MFSLHAVVNFCVISRTRNHSFNNVNINGSNYDTNNTKDKKFKIMMILVNDDKKNLGNAVPDSKEKTMIMMIKE